MKPLFTSATCSAAVLALGMAVFAQTTQNPQTPAQQPATSGAQAGQDRPAAADAQQQMTLVGCVQKESEFRSARNAGAGGAAGTGVGAGNEFVLIAARSASGSTASATTGSPEAVGTSGAAGEAYELTGPGEGQLAQYVGKRVEIMGRLKGSAAASDRPAAPGAAGAAGPAGEPGQAGQHTQPGQHPQPGQAGQAGQAGRPGGQVDPMGQDLNLKEFEVTSVRESSGSCPPSTPR